MYRTGSSVRTNKIQYELQTFPPFGKDKVFMDFSFLAIAFSMNWLMKLFYKITTAIFRCWEQTNQRSIQNIAT